MTTDIDLRNSKKLEAVAASLDHKDSGAPVGMEIWLKNASKSKHDFVPLRIWIDHRKRAVSFDSSTGDVSGTKHAGDDRECGFRYCCDEIMCIDAASMVRVGHGVPLLVVHGISSSP